MKTIGFGAVKKYLDPLSPEELAIEFKGMFDACPDVREYLTVKLSEGGQQALLEKYKAIIAKEFYASQAGTMHGQGRLSVARRAVVDFSRMSTSTTDILDIMFFYLERLIEFVDCYGCDVESFHNSIASMFDRACTYAKKNGLASTARSRAHAIAQSVVDFGYGTADELEELLAQHYPIPNDIIDVEAVV